MSVYPRPSAAVIHFKLSEVLEDELEVELAAAVDVDVEAAVDVDAPVDVEVAVDVEAVVMDTTRTRTSIVLEISELVIFLMTKDEESPCSTLSVLGTVPTREYYPPKTMKLQTRMS
mmetsp:Transcript_19307/g.23855  ORF Transcript_19307/g.23855 Transcript_19307/m.23855 type:complete len:116 (-) Transcript_19307:1052-1399(-)